VFNVDVNADEVAQRVEEEKIGEHFQEHVHPLLLSPVVERSVSSCWIY
jgi:hypothetical protein